LPTLDILKTAHVTIRVDFHSDDPSLRDSVTAATNAACTGVTCNQALAINQSGLVSPSAACWHACSPHLSVPCLPLPAPAQLIN